MSDTFTDKIEYQVCQGDLSASDVYTKMMGYFGKDKARIEELDSALLVIRAMSSIEHVHRVCDNTLEKEGK